MIIIVALSVVEFYTDKTSQVADQKDIKFPRSNSSLPLDCNAYSAYTANL